MGFQVSLSTSPFPNQWCQGLLSTYKNLQVHPSEDSALEI